MLGLTNFQILLIAECPKLVEGEINRGNQKYQDKLRNLIINIKSEIRNPDPQ